MAQRKAAEGAGEEETGGEASFQEGWRRML